MDTETTTTRRMRWQARLCITWALLCVCASAFAHPALWVTRSSTATVYLFGTVHVLPKDAHWHYPALDSALATSDALYVEEDDDDPLSMQGLVLEYGMDLQHPLSNLLDAADKARLAAAAQAAGVPGGMTSLNAMRPWLAALTISVAPLLKAGYDPKSGVDKQLERAFAAAGKPVAAFETAASQIRLLADMPDAQQLDLLRSALDDYAKGPKQIDALIEAWQAGNVAAIARNLDGDMRAHYPKLYRALLVDRNRDFAQRIARLLKRRGTFFVAVGAGHFAGPDSVQVQLAKSGIETGRVH
jgi:uncharacterized protein